MLYIHKKILLLWNTAPPGSRLECLSTPDGTGVLNGVLYIVALKQWRGRKCASGCFSTGLQRSLVGEDNAQSSGNIIDWKGLPLKIVSTYVKCAGLSFGKNNVHYSFYQLNAFNFNLHSRKVFIQVWTGASWRGGVVPNLRILNLSSTRASNGNPWKRFSHVKALRYPPLSWVEETHGMEDRLRIPPQVSNVESGVIKHRNVIQYVQNQRFFFMEVM